jgi:tripartite-type tricarboxylate transporter receptor subunit TctC
MEESREGRGHSHGMRRRTALGLGAAFTTALASRAWAEGYPDRPIRMIVPFAPGGGGDIIVRLIGQQLGQHLGENVVIENRAGAGGDVGTDVAVHSRPDGYTLLMANVAPIAINVHLYKKLPYDPLKDFTAISPFAVFPNVLVVRPNLDVHSVAELIAYAKTNPQGLSFASAGTGSITHLSAEMFKLATGVPMVHVAYRGGGPALAALAGSQIDLYFSSVPAALPYIKAGTLRALGVTSRNRVASAPDIPTLQEAGLPGYEAVTWIGLVGPAGVPAPVVERLNREASDILRAPEMKQRLIGIGAEAFIATPAAFDTYIRTEVKRWADVVKAAGLSPQ